MAPSVISGVTFVVVFFLARLSSDVAALFGLHQRIGITVNLI